jgi:hypothetical protein
MMTYRELYENALYDLEHDKITLGEFWKVTEPLEKKVDTSIISDWIPCSEQEPAEDGYYLVCWSDGQVETEWYDNEGWGYFDVVAWMPLPKPYKG